jgi:hypothetical protein
MACCCSNPTHLGCIDICTDDLKTGLVAAVTGDYTFRFNFQNVISYFTKQYLVGNDLDVPNSYFVISNGNYVYEVKVIDPNGVELGCFNFQTVTSC